MKNILLLLLLALGLAACSTAHHYRRYERQHPELVARAAMLREVRASGITDARLLDSLYPRRLAARPLPESVRVQPHRSLLAKVLGRRKPAEASLPQTALPARLGKKSTLQVFYAPATVTSAGKKAQVAAGAGATASVVQKKAGPAQVASDSSTQNALTGGGNLASTQGDGNTTGQTKQDTTREAPGVGATIARALAGPVGVALGLVLAGGLVWGLVAWRRKKQATNLLT